MKQRPLKDSELRSLLFMLQVVEFCNLGDCLTKGSIKGSAANSDIQNDFAVGDSHLMHCFSEKIFIVNFLRD